MRLFKNILLCALISTVARAAAPTFADLAVLVAKGYFRNEVRPDASLEQCAAFLNSKGVCFSLFDLMDPDRTVLKEDVARVVGQSMLLFSGEAEVVNGCIKKPLGVETWVDYCRLNDIPLERVWNGFVKSTADGSLPEVRKFFGRSFGRAEKGDIK